MPLREFKQKRAADAFHKRLRRKGHFEATVQEEQVDPHGSTRRARARKRYIVDYDNPSKRSIRKRVAKALSKYVRGNPPRVKGRKTKGGGRSVTLRGFTGTVTKKGGQVIIRGRGRR
jgi:hypothetical protein